MMKKVIKILTTVIIVFMIISALPIAYEVSVGASLSWSLILEQMKQVAFTSVLVMIIILIFASLIWWVFED